MARKPRSRLHRIVRGQLAQAKGRILLAALCTGGVIAVELLKPWPLKLVLDYGVLHRPLPAAFGFLRGVAGPGSTTFLVAASAAIVGIAVGGGAIGYSRTLLTSSIGYGVVYSIRRELFSHLQRLSLSFHTRARSGDLLTRIAGDTNLLRDVFAEDLLDFGTHVLTVLGMLGIMVALNWRIGFIALATLPLLGYSLFYLYRKSRASVKSQRKQEGKVASRMNEVLAAVSLVQAYGRERYEEERFDEATAKTLQRSLRTSRLEAAASRSSEIITSVGTAAAVLFGALQVAHGRMLPGDLVLVASYLTGMYRPLRSLAKLSTNFSRAAASAERLSEVLNLEPEIRDRPDAIEAVALRGAIAFEQVRFGYRGGRDVLRGISFEVSPGRRLALVGASGAGKSTVASLLLRLYDPGQGRITIDGVDIRHYRRESLRRQIAIVLQHSILFGATIRENIAYGKPEATEQEIVAAARIANADEFIRELENGYDAVVGERGATLSGGQRQRIAIARAVVRDAPILVLDEPMTGLDVESEAKVREALDRLMAGRTCVLITHDLQAIAGADEVLLLEEGRIADRGTHAGLMTRSARYRELYELNLAQPEAGLPA